MPTIAYRYIHALTESTTGYFSCEPPEDMTFEDMLLQLEQTPHDEFLHRAALRRIGTISAERLQQLFEQGGSVFKVLLCEAHLFSPNDATLAEMATALSPETQERIGVHTPLPHLALARNIVSRSSDSDMAAWGRLFEANLLEFHPLPHPGDGDLPLPGARFLDPQQEASHKKLMLEQAFASYVSSKEKRPVWSRPPAEETAAQALTNLASAGIIAGVEMRHESSLSPIGLLRHWQVAVSVQNGKLSHTLHGQATTWGRGLSLASARASYAMEMIERASAYLSINGIELENLLQPCSLIRSTYLSLREQGRAALDPATLAPGGVPFSPGRTYELYWMEGSSSTGTILVPVQAVGLFCNLDEPMLHLMPGSTGLASGNTLEEAKLSALTELLERDAEATVPWCRAQCFELLASPSEDQAVAALLADYTARGIQVRFRELITEFGLPCYQCFVRKPDGVLVRGSGAGLSARQALLAAMTETPYPYPHGPASSPAPAGLPQRNLSDLPDYRLESPDRNLELLETVLASHGYQPVYVTLTREDLEFPVVRVLVPGLESGIDLDRFSPPSPRLFRRYFNMFDPVQP